MGNNQKHSCESNLVPHPPRKKIYKSISKSHFSPFRSHSGSFRFIPVSFRSIPVSFRFIPVSFRSHSGSFRFIPVSFRFIPVRSGPFRSVPVRSGPFRSVPVFSNAPQSHQLNNENELSGYKLFEKMCAETDQERRHRLEVLRQNDFVIEVTRGDKKYTIIKIVWLEIYLTNGR